MTTEKSSAQHPGEYLRELVLKPKKLAVTKAAELVGVGRPAFSNFINGKAAATPEMAARVEVAFGVEAAKLLAMQAEFDSVQVKPGEVAVSARRFVVPLLEFKANDFESWVTNNIRARTRLSVLLRTLVNSTAQPTKSDFPGNDDAERPGWDGWSECEVGNPWVPAGAAGWEFGTNAEPREKANDDFAKSVNALAATERMQTTFVFVTPRRWASKADWLQKKRAEKKWKDVRAYDATDLEQWVAQSVSAQAWLASEMGVPTKEVASLDDAWQLWSASAKSSMPVSLFDTAVTLARPKFLQWVAAAPEKPFVIASDSKEEALAFVSALLPAEAPELAATRDRVVVFQAAGALGKLAKGATDFIAVAASEDVQQELAATRDLHAVVVLPRNAAGIEADAVLEPLTSEAFRSALDGAGYNQDDIGRLAKESGRSLTILRRRLSKLPAVQSPPWSKDAATAAALIPLYLAGSWNSKNERDATAITRMAAVADGDLLEQKVQELAALEQAPVWSVSTYRGVFSKLDAMFATRSFVTRAILERFFEQAKVILEEDDPKLDLPEDKRWAAAIYNKSREYSQSLREGVAETLVLLAVHGDELFGNRIGLRCNDEVENLVQQLLLPLTTRRLEAAGADLLAFAEAAPEVFLRALERDLESPEPASVGLLRPADTMFGGCPRTYLLWALEGLAWNPNFLGRAALILARLAKVEISDNWGNKPLPSLVAIFRAWMPQTAASIDERLRAVHLLVNKVPTVAWRLAMSLLDPRDQVGSPSHKPRWRNDGYGHGEPVPTMEPILTFNRGVADLALNWKEPYTAQMVCDLIELLAGMDDEHANRVWDLVQQWAKSARDEEKADVREKVRVSVLSKRAAKRAKRSDWPAMTEKGRKAFKLLEPSNVVFKHGWLFKQTWVPDSADELMDDRDFKARDMRIHELRTNAVREVFAGQGFSGLRSLAEQGAAAEIVGSIAAAEVLDNTQLQEFAFECATREPFDWTAKALVSGLMRGLPEEGRAAFLQRLRGALSDSQYIEFLVRAAFNRHTWLLVEQMAPPLQDSYWKSVMPWHATDEDVAEAVRRLTAAGRPRAAFHVAQYQLKLLGPEMVYDLLMQIAHSKGEEAGEYKLDQHWLQEAFALLSTSSNLSLEQKAILEFFYIDALWTRISRTDKHLIPNLEKYVEQNPDFYVQALVWAFRRRDGQEDPPELKAAEASRSLLAERAYKLLEALSRVPGYGNDDKPSLKNLGVWLEYVRTKARELGRLEVADSCLGRLLSTEPAGQDQVWPGQLAREAFELIRTDEVANGAVVARMNSRGVVTRGRGGMQERELANRYREWASALRYSHPFVANNVLEALARSYERHAEREDEDELLRERLE